MRTMILVCVAVTSIGCDRAGARYVKAKQAYTAEVAALEQIEAERQSVVDEYERLRTTARQMMDEARYEATETRGQVRPISVYAGEPVVNPISTSIAHNSFADTEKMAEARLEHLEIVYAQRMKQWDERVLAQRDRVQSAKADQEAAERARNIAR